MATTWAVACVGIAFSAAAQSNVFSNIVGYNRVTVPGDALEIVSNPFETSPNDIGSVISNQLNGAVNEAAADAVLKWDQVDAEYDRFFMIDDTGGPFDGTWFQAGVGPTMEPIVPGEGMMIINKDATNARTLVFTGDVITNATVATEIKPGLQLVSYPYSSSINLVDTTLTNAMQGAANEAAADVLLKWDSTLERYRRFFIVDGTGGPFDGTWFEANVGPVATETLNPGEGFWIINKSGITNLWVENIPYDVNAP